MIREIGKSTNRKQITHLMKCTAISYKPIMIECLTNETQNRIDVKI
jgi:hypothetical protein